MRVTLEIPVLSPRLPPLWLRCSSSPGTCPQQAVGCFPAVPSFSNHFCGTGRNATTAEAAGTIQRPNWIYFEHFLYLLYFRRNSRDGGVLNVVSYWV